MTNIIRRGIIFLLTLSLFACSSSKKSMQPSETIITDSVVERVRIEYRDTIVKRPGVVIKVPIKIPCPELNMDTTVKVKNEGSIKFKTTSPGVMEVTCETDSLKILIDSLKNVLSEKERYQRKEVFTPVIKEKIVHKVPKWCWILLCLNIGYGIFRFRKPIGKLLGSI